MVFVLRVVVPKVERRVRVPEKHRGSAVGARGWAQTMGRQLGGVVLALRKAALVCELSISSFRKPYAHVDTLSTRFHPRLVPLLQFCWLS